MNTTETARATVHLDGKQAEEQLEFIRKRAIEVRSEMIKLAKSNDLQGYNRAKKELRELDAVTKSYKRSVFEVDKVLKNLSGSSLNELIRAQKKLSEEIKSSNRNTREEIAAYNDKVEKLKKVNKAIGQAREEAGLASKSFGRMNNVFSSLKSLLPALGVGFVVAQVGRLAREFFNLTKEIEFFERKAKFVFGDSLSEVNAAANEHAHIMGLTRKEYLGAAANVADLLVPLGFTRDSAAGLSIQLTNLSGALDEWSGGSLGAAQVNEILTKALLGETEQLKQLGIVVDQSSKSYNERIASLQKNNGLTLEQARAMDILTQIQSKSTDAQTAFAARGETLIRTQKSISTWWRQMKENVVEYFSVPTSEKLIEEKDNLNLLVNSILSVNDNQDVRNRLIKELDEDYPSFLGKLEREKLTNEQLRDRLNEVNDEYEKKIKFQVYEEDLEANLAEARLKQKEQNEIVKSINKDYDYYIQKKEEGLNFEEKANRLAQMSLGLVSNNISMYGTMSTWEEQLKLTAVTRLEKYKTLQTDINNLNKEYNEILESQNALGLKKREDKDGGTGDPDSDVKARMQREREYRQQIIRDSKTLIDQENLNYQERLKQAGLFEKNRQEMTDEELQASLILEQEHLKKIQEINDQALSEKIDQQQAFFDKVTLQRQISLNEEIASMGDDEAAKQAAREKFDEQELTRKKRFLQDMLDQLQDVLSGEDVFPGIDEMLLTETEKEALRARIDQIKLMLSELGIKVKEIRSGGAEEEESEKFGEGASEIGTDIFGMIPADWVELIENLRNVNETTEDLYLDVEAGIEIVGALIDAWSMYSQFVSNMENQQMNEYEAGVNRKKALLQSQLDQGVINQEQYNDQVKAMDEDLDQKKKELAIKQAKREKATALMGAIVNTALAVVKALQVSPPWLGIVLAALVGVMGGLQIATIASQPIPQYAKGYYDVIGEQDRKTYKARMIDSPGTGYISDPAILVGEKPEIIIDPYTTRNLQLNYPEVIEAINAARVPQYRTGQFQSPVISSSGANTAANSELNRSIANLEVTLGQLRIVLNDMSKRGIEARLVANGDYIATHKETMTEYDSLLNQVSLRG